MVSCLKLLLLLSWYISAYGANARRKLIDTDFLPPESQTVSCGSHHSCRIHGAGGSSFIGQVECWGSKSPIGMPSQINAVMVASGTHHTCAIADDGSLYCWGSCCTVPPLGQFSQVCSGSSYSCAVREADGTVECWGKNSKGQTTIPDALLGQPELQVVQISCGTAHTCALLQNGSVVCWGDDAFGQTNPPAEVATDGETQLVQISAGATHTIGLTTEHNVICWGSNSNNQCAFHGSLGKFKQVVAGNKFSCALTESEGKLSCIGQTTQITKSIRQKSATGWEPMFQDISAGSRHVCGVDNQNNLVCLGTNDPPPVEHDTGSEMYDEL